ncbi:MAG TPA: hypothetical protein VF796_21065 [Humisphaera sp.]
MPGDRGRAYVSAGGRPPTALEYAHARPPRRKLKSALDGFAVGATFAAWATVLGWEASAGSPLRSRVVFDYVIPLAFTALVACGVGMVTGGLFAVWFHLLTRLGLPASYRRSRFAAACGAVAGVAVTSAGYLLGFRLGLPGYRGGMVSGWVWFGAAAAVVPLPTFVYVVVARRPRRRSRRG